MKVLQRAARKALILSPVASHPQDFGNRRRVYQTCDYLRKQGYEIHFLLYPMEPDWMARVQDAAHDMHKEWDSFQIIPSSRSIPLQSPAVGEHHTIDEWWDPTIGTHLEWLLPRMQFDVFVVNYVFMSKAFEYAGGRTVKVLETHDRFAGRKELLNALGARIESFYTTDAEEKIALDRADIVVAIKESEAEFYRGLTPREVISVPFWIAQEARAPQPLAPDAERVLRVGFIGALNVVNVANMAAFLREFERSRAVAAAPLVLDVAGDVCHQLQSAHPQVRLLGRIESLETFYDTHDVIVVPMTLSTGLKIKTGEALAFGKAVVSVDDGFDGFPAVDEFHDLKTFAAVCRALVVLARDRARLVELEKRSRISAVLARRRTEQGYRRLASAISRFLPAILFLTDEPVFEEGNVGVERLAQWCQLCAGLASTVVGYVGDGAPFARRPELAGVDVVALGDASGQMESAFAAWDEITRRHTISEIIISVDGDAAPVLWKTAVERCRHVTLDTWRPALAQIAKEQAAAPTPDYWPTVNENGHNVVLSATAFRYRPRYLEAWNAARPKGTLVVLCGPNEADRTGLDLLWSTIAAPGTGCVVALADAPGAPLRRDFFERLRASRRPAVLVAVGIDAPALAVCDALGAIFGAPCLHVTAAQFPLLIVAKDGTPLVCETYADLAHLAADLDILARSAPIHGADTGWSTYKKNLVRRLGAHCSFA